MGGDRLGERFLGARPGLWPVSERESQDGELLPGERSGGTGERLPGRTRCRAASPGLSQGREPGRNEYRESHRGRELGDRHREHQAGLPEIPRMARTDVRLGKRTRPEVFRQACRDR